MVNTGIAMLKSKLKSDTHYISTYRSTSFHKKNTTIYHEYQYIHTLKKERMKESECAEGDMNLKMYTYRYICICTKFW